MNDKPTELKCELPIDEGTGLPYVWLVWGVTPDPRVELIAIASTEAKRDSYIAGAFKHHRQVYSEKAFVDHAFGSGMLRALAAVRWKR